VDSTRDPSGEFDKILRFYQPLQSAVASSTFGGDGETDISRTASNTVTNGTMKESREANGGLRLNFDNLTTETVNTGNNNMKGSMNGNIEEEDSYTPRSLVATMPETPSLQGPYTSPQIHQQYQSSPTGIFTSLEWIDDDAIASGGFASVHVGRSRGSKVNYCTDSLRRLTVIRSL
jgi:hypothetical protein